MCFPAGRPIIPDIWVISARIDFEQPDDGDEPLSLWLCSSDRYVKSYALTGFL
jgi:hypothetical protein